MSFWCIRFSELSQQKGGVLEGYQLEEALQNLSLVESEEVSEEKLQSVHVLRLFLNLVACELR